jgi:hypothetical protein
LKDYLVMKTPEELKADIINLVKLFEGVKEYYIAKINPASEAGILGKYKAIVEAEFVIQKSGRVKLRFSLMRKSVTDFQKIARDVVNVADLMLFIVEAGVRFSNKVGGIDEPFYDSLSSIYRKFLKYMTDWNLTDLFQERCKELVKASHDTGYGFGDELDELYEDNFPI